MDVNNLENGAQVPAPPQPSVRPARAGSLAPPAPPNQTHVAQQPSPVPPTVATGRPSGGRSSVFKVLIGLVLFSVVSVVLLVGVVMAVFGFRLFDSDPVGPEASPPFVQPEVTTGGTTGEVNDRDGVTITWDASPSSCDENDKRLFAALLDNATLGGLEVRMRILDPAGNFIHQSHVYEVPASDQFRVHLGAIPSGPSTVQIVAEASDEVMAQTMTRFDDC